MTPLHDTSGRHIANEVNGQLHSPSGKNIGHPMPGYPGAFIDMRGEYLGEIVQERRLLRRLNHPSQNASWGVLGDAGNVGSHGDPGSIGSCGSIPDYVDVPTSKLG